MGKELRKAEAETDEDPLFGQHNIICPKPPSPRQTRNTRDGHWLVAESFLLKCFCCCLATSSWLACHEYLNALKWGYIKTIWENFLKLDFLGQTANIFRYLKMTTASNIHREIYALQVLLTSSGESCWTASLPLISLKCPAKWNYSELPILVN